VVGLSVDVSSRYLFSLHFTIAESKDFVDLLPVLRSSILFSSVNICAEEECVLVQHSLH
jgi:hypothetical protein